MTLWPPLLSLLIRPLRRLNRRKLPDGTEPGRWKLLRDAPADWKDTVYQPKGFRRRK
jgi:hypothetical protein